MPDLLNDYLTRMQLDDVHITEYVPILKKAAVSSLSGVLLILMDVDADRSGPRLGA